MPGEQLALTAEEAARQSLAAGTAGTALAHIERAMTTGDWTSADAHIRQVTTGPIDGGAHTGLFYGLPAVMFVLHTASADGDPRYRCAAEALDAPLLRLARRRLRLAAERMSHGAPAAFGEYDLLYGLTGVGALLLLRAPGDDAFADILRHLVRLTEPRREGGQALPGWWVAHDPDPILPSPGGHANLGMAHGAAGILALLALAARRGHLVDGHATAIEYLLDWIDRWRQDSNDGPWWPEWLTREDLRTGRPTQDWPGLVSWCYGAVGIGRARQLAAIALNDAARRTAAENDLAASLTDHNLNRIIGAGLCHGMAGVYQTTYRATQDTRRPALQQRLPALATALARQAARRPAKETPGLLTGDAGTSLASHTTRHTLPPRSGWDACLLIT
jgi:hypothetical protein